MSPKERILKINNGIPFLVGNTPIVRIPSLSELTGCEILLKCENLNPGGSVKDRAAAFMIAKAERDGALRPGMTIVEGTAGNTGIGLTLVGRAKGYDARIVMPTTQTAEKKEILRLYGAQLELVDAVPFKNPNNYFHVASRYAEKEPEKYWWADQFNNLANFEAHRDGTAPEIEEQLDGKLDVFVSTAGTGGTIAGNSVYLKSKIAGLEVVLVDPEGSGMKNYVETGVFASSGTSITEGIGIGRLVENFKQAQIDRAISLADSYVVSIAHYLRDRDGILLGSSAALNVAGALQVARSGPKGRRILTIWCDQGQRSASKLYNDEFLQGKGLVPKPGDVSKWRFGSADS